MSPSTEDTSSQGAAREARVAKQAVLGPEAYRAIYENGPDGVMFTAPDGRVLAANPAACAILGRTEAEICATGRQGMVDSSDERWTAMVAARDRDGRVSGVGRMIRGDGTLIEVDVSAQVFSQDDGEQRSCTIIRDATERLRMERELLALSATLRELTLTDELTGLRNRRGFDVVGSQMLDVADREKVAVQVLFADVDNLKLLNDRLGHDVGDAALLAVAAALRHALRRDDVVARIGGDEFVALTLGLAASDRAGVESRIREYLRAETAVPEPTEVSIGWAMRTAGEPATVEDLLAEADRSMYLAKKGEGQSAKRAR